MQPLNVAESVLVLMGAKRGPGQRPQRSAIPRLQQVGPKTPETMWCQDLPCELTNFVVKVLRFGNLL